MVNLSKDILNIRYNNMEKYRYKLISEVQQKRRNIIKEMEHNKKKSKTKHNSLSEDKSMEKEIKEMIDKGTRTLKKIKQIQKCKIQEKIENKLQKDIVKLKSDKKERKIKEINEKIKKEMRLKKILEDHKIKEKEKIRKQTKEKYLKEMEKKNEEKQKEEEKKIKGIFEKQEKSRIEMFLGKTQSFKLLEKRKDAFLNQLRESSENRYKENEEKNTKIEKELEDLFKKERDERILLNEKKEKEIKERLTRNRLQKEENIETLRKFLDLKDELIQSRLTGIALKRHRNLHEQKMKFEQRLKSIEIAMRKTNYDMQKRNDKIKEHQLHIDSNIERVERQKKEKILERVRSPNYLFLRSLKKREHIYKQLNEKFYVLNKKLENKDKKVHENKMNKIKYRTIRQEDEYIKQYEKQFNIKRINRIRLLKSKKIEEEISKKEQKIKNYKIRKQTLLEKNVLLSDSIERQKFKLIDDFDNALKNKELNSELVKELFPEDKNFYEKIKNMTNEVYKKYNDNNNSQQAKEIFLTQSIKNEKINKSK